MKWRARIASIGGIGVLLIAALWLAFGTKEKEVRYKGKSVSEWFYITHRLMGSDDVFKDLGTNAFPFLLSTLKQRGNSELYFKLYAALPGSMQAQLRRPISGDDLQMASLSHIYKIPNVPNTIPEPWLATLAKEVRDLQNPRVRLQGLHTLYRLTRYEREPLVSLCTRLLDDPHFGIRLEAALCLADLGIKEARTLPILLAALEDKEKLVSSESISSYKYGQPPGGSGIPVPRFPGQGQAEWGEVQRRRILNALESLDPPLNEAQKKLILRQRKLMESQ